MAIILYCRNGHDLGTRDPVFMGRTTFQREVARVQSANRERLLPRDPYCVQCGSPTLDACEKCKAPIAKGRKPAYCGKCSEPFPWTATALAAAAEFADGLAPLTLAEKREFRGTLLDLTADTPRTPLAVSRFKALGAKVGPVAWETFSKILVGVVTDAAKKGLGL
jgi:hypothetical protein